MTDFTGTDKSALRLEIMHARREGCTAVAVPLERYDGATIAAVRPPSRGTWPYRATRRRRCSRCSFDGAAPGVRVCWSCDHLTLVLLLPVRARIGICASHPRARSPFHRIFASERAFSRTPKSNSFTMVKTVQKIIRADRKKTSRGGGTLSTDEIMALTRR